MNHEQAVDNRREELGMNMYYQLYPNVINFFGTPEKIARALIFLNSKDANKITYKGWGECQSVYDGRSSFDVKVEIPSFSGNHEPYQATVALRKFNGNKLRVDRIYPQDCSCEDSLYVKGVGKQDDNCKHNAARIIYLQENFPKISEKELKEPLEMDKIYFGDYMEESFYFVKEKYDKKTLDLFTKLENDNTLRAPYKKDIFRNHIFVENYPDGRKPLFFRLDEKIRSNYREEYREIVKKSKGIS